MFKVEVDRECPGTDDLVDQCHMLIGQESKMLATKADMTAQVTTVNC